MLMLFPLPLLLLTGCAAGPDYVSPDPQVPDAWRNAAIADLNTPYTSDTRDSPLESWWTAFNDTLLVRYIQRARIANRDLAMAVARIEEARALHRVAGGTYFPQVQASARMARAELAPNGPNGAAVTAGAANPSTNWEVGGAASWELDLFGKVRRTREATGARLEASVEDYRDVMVSLFAQVASTYIDVRTLQSRLAFARRNVASQQETMGIVIAREDAGLVPLLDVSRARSNLANTEAVIPQLEAALEQARNGLAVLLGQWPGSLDAELAVVPERNNPETGVLLDLPVDLLRRRPDV
ncbi:MAG: RND transporter, partial [Deltaproteobacteria bacterium]